MRWTVGQTLPGPSQALAASLEGIINNSLALGTGCPCPYNADERKAVHVSVALPIHPVLRRCSDNYTLHIAVQRPLRKEASGGNGGTGRGVGNLTTAAPAHSCTETPSPTTYPQLRVLPSGPGAYHSHEGVLPPGGAVSQGSCKNVGGLSHAQATHTLLERRSDACGGCQGTVIVFPHSATYAGFHPGQGSQNRQRQQTPETKLAP
jgi:hypothetical protein